MMIHLGQMPLIVGPAVTPDSCVILGASPPSCPGGQQPICVSTPPVISAAGDYVEQYPRADWVCPDPAIFGPDPTVNIRCTAVQKLCPDGSEARAVPGTFCDFDCPGLSSLPVWLLPVGLIGATFLLGGKS